MAMDREAGRFASPDPKLSHDSTKCHVRFRFILDVGDASTGPTVPVGRRRPDPQGVDPIATVGAQAQTHAAPAQPSRHRAAALFTGESVYLFRALIMSAAGFDRP
jgi:hypothetical protein